MIPKLANRLIYAKNKQINFSTGMKNFQFRGFHLILLYVTWIIQRL